MDCLKDRKLGGDGEGGGLLSMIFGAPQADELAREQNATVNSLASKLEVDKLGASFARFAGSDETMDRNEYDEFTKASNITRQQAFALWNILDADNSGQVSKKEFASALANLQAARAWVRYCPDCIYENVCAYCQECNANCSDCNEMSFCAKCWKDHPSKHRKRNEEEEEMMAQKLTTTELLRTHLVIKPLNWAYTSSFTQWMPIRQKALLRQALRAQQQKVADALQVAQEEEEAALKARGF